MLESPTPTGASAAAEPPASATPQHGPHATGLRERKKEQTRLRIIEVGLNLCDTQGFDATTIEQIANEANVSPRTINRYFDSKEDIVLGPIKDFGAGVAAALRRLPITGNELESLRTAFLEVIDRATSPNAEGPISFRQFQQMQRIMRSSPSVSARGLEHADEKHVAIAEALAERLATTPDALSVRLVLGVWHLIGQLGMECSNMVDDQDLMAAAESGRTAFTSTYDEFMRLCGQGTSADRG